jgi:Mn2+/Fe2+ NRAMP family transporter
MNKAVSVALLLAGIVFLISGINAQESLASNARHAVAGISTDKSLWLIVLGLIGVVVGGLTSFFGRSSH